MCLKIVIMVVVIFICVSSGGKSRGRVQRPTKARLQLSSWSYLNNTHHDDYYDDDDDDDDDDDNDDDDYDDKDGDNVDDEYLLLIDFSVVQLVKLLQDEVDDRPNQPSWQRGGIWAISKPGDMLPDNFWVMPLSWIKFNLLLQNCLNQTNL